MSRCPTRSPAAQPMRSLTYPNIRWEEPPAARSRRRRRCWRCPRRRPLSRVRIWDGSTPWLITGYDEARDAVRRFAGQRRRPAARLPALERGHAVDGAQAAAIGVHLRRRGAHPVPPDVVQALHLQAGRRPASGDPAGHRRTDRRDAGRAAARRHRRGAGAAGAVAGDQRDARRAVRGPRDSSSTTPTSGWRGMPPPRTP